MTHQLIKLTKTLIVSPSEILTATRLGNYTDVVLRQDNRMLQIRDEDMTCAVD